MFNKTSLARTAVAILFAATPAIAHHSVAAQFDTSKEITLIGAITKVENMNPHSWFHVDVTGPDGKVTRWKLEGLSPNNLIRQGLKVKTDIRIGETYQFRIAPAWKDPEDVKMGFLKAITVNGKEYVLIEL